MTAVFTRNGVIPMISFDKYSVSYGCKTVLRDFSFRLDASGTYAVVGPSGCGKTTLVYSVCGLLPKSAQVTGAREKNSGATTATVLQDYGLLPWKTVYDNAALPLVLKGLSASDHGDRVSAVLSQLGILERSTAYPHELSGGQKQRLAIARAFLTEADLIVMDEPFSSVDTITREKLQDDLKHLIQNSGKTLFLVTHSIEEAVVLAERILVMSGSGELVRVVDNPCYGIENPREDDRFYRTCISLRKSMRGEDA